jgi:hypothetical protein
VPTAKKSASAKKPPSEAADLRARIAKALRVSEEQAELRALREMAESLGLFQEKVPEHGAPQPTQHASPQAGYLPQRLYLLMDGRGLDGRGMPQEVIDLPCIIGSSKKSNVWINSPRIETHHLRITHGDEGWLLEDMGSEHGTFLGDKKIKRRVIQDGDEYRLAGYLRLRAELR